MAIDWTHPGLKILPGVAFHLLLSALPVALGLRKGPRGFSFHVLGTMGWFGVLVLVVNIALATSVAALVVNGFWHYTNLSPDEVPGFGKALYVGRMLCGLAESMSLRISLPLVPLDIFRVAAGPRARKITSALMDMLVLYGLWLVAGTVIHAIPFYAPWDIFVPGREGFGFSTRWAADAAVSLSLEAVMFCLPFPILGFLNISWRPKLRVCFGFALGISVCIASGMRFPYLYVPEGPRIPTPRPGGTLMVDW